MSPCQQLLPLLQDPFKLLLKVHGDFTAVGLQPALSLAILKGKPYSEAGGCLGQAACSQHGCKTEEGGPTQ